MPHTKPFRPTLFELPHQRSLGQPWIGLEPRDQIVEVFLGNRLLGEEVLFAHQNGPLNSTISGASLCTGVQDLWLSCTIAKAVLATVCALG